MTLEQKILVFDMFSSTTIVSNELEQGGLPKEKMLVAVEYDTARSQILNCSGKIPVAVLYLRLSPEYAESTRNLHGSLLVHNPSMAIYYAVSAPIPSFVELQSFGVLPQNIEGILPMHFGAGSALRSLGRDLQQKYFSSEKVN